MSSPWAFRFFLALGLAAQALVAEAQGGAQRWVFTTTVGQSHFDNLLLLPDIPGDTLNTVATSLLYGRASPRFGLSVSGQVSANRYWEFSQSSQLNYGGGIAASLTPSPKLKLSLGLSANQGFYAPLLLGLGVQAPGTRADSANATVAAD